MLGTIEKMVGTPISCKKREPPSPLIKLFVTVFGFGYYP
jgi:hypothetical protein